MLDAARFATPGIPASRGAEWIHHYLSMQDGRMLNHLAAGTATTPPIPVYANHGRWIVDCPDCLNAQLACRSDKRFLCNECGNIGVSGLWRRVDWPKDDVAIETELHRRPLANQNWVPRLNLNELKAESLAHGVL